MAVRDGIRALFAVLLAACSSGGGMAGPAPGGGYSPRAGEGLSRSALVGEIGRYLDDQARDLESIPGADVQRRDDSLLVKFADSVLFETGKSTLQPAAYDRLRTLARTLNDYPHSHVIVKGHTDSVGEDALNQRLSEERADQVRNFLIAEAVAPIRLTAIGFGESMPVARNETQVGRSQNRRVEVEIRPDAEIMQGG